MSTTLRSRLEEVAAASGGFVALHGKHLAQWLHHAYPYECPAPHHSGAAGSPHTADEWMQSSSASPEEHLTRHASIIEREALATSDSCPMPAPGAPVPEDLCGGNGSADD